MITIYVDGANPGSGMSKSCSKDARICFVVIQDGKIHIKEESLTEGNSLDVEWLSFFSAIEYCTINNLDDVLFMTDCLAVYDIVMEYANARSEKQKMYKEQFQNMKKPENFSLEFVGRGNNLAGIYLEDNGKSLNFRTKLFYLEGLAI